MKDTILIVPGFMGSGPAHWQSWFEGELPNARRVGRIDWDAPVIANWAYEIRQEIESTAGAVWLVAHSFGCLAAIAATADPPCRVAGALFVAPADPDRFSSSGLGTGNSNPSLRSLSCSLTRQPLPYPSLVVASANDPWISLHTAACWADLWGSRFINIGAAGHINIDSGFGPWPQGLELFRSVQQPRAGDSRNDIGARWARLTAGKRLP